MLILELLTDVWDNVLGPKGLLSSKARILCTNAITWLPACDKIVMLRGGIILETSTFDQVRTAMRQQMCRTILIPK